MSHPMLKHMSNHHFRRTENSILSALLSSKKILSARVIAKRAHISRTTLYRHHHSVHAILPDLEHYILQKYDRLMRGLLRRPQVSMQTLYLQTLVFISQNQLAFTAIIERDSDRTLEQMIYRLIPRLGRLYPLPSNSQPLVTVYAKEISGIISLWVQGGCKAPEEEILADLMYLTKFVRQHLSGLIK